MLAHITTVAPVSIDSLALALAALVWGVGALVVATLLADRRGLLPRSQVSFRRWTATLAAACSLGAAAIHFAVIGDHFAEYPPYGVAFAAFAWFQVGWAVSWVAMRRRMVAFSAVAVNGGALAVWAISRWVGLPLGLEPGQLESIGPLDLAAGALEIGLIAILTWDLGIRAVRFRPALSTAGAAIVIGSGALAIVMLTSVAFVAAGGETHGQAVDIPAPIQTAAPPPSALDLSTPGPSDPTTAAPAAGRVAGRILFGSSLDLEGQLETPTSEFRPGDAAVWIADFTSPPDSATIVLLIVQILPDGREFEHWRQEIRLDDPGARRLVAGADLSIYVHGGEGSYWLRYLSGDELLAEGAFELVP